MFRLELTLDHLPVVEKIPHHPLPVLFEREAIVMRFGRHRLVELQIPFVGEVHKARAKLLKILLLDAGDFVKDDAHFRLVERTPIVFVVLRQTDRHHADRLDMRPQRRQIADRLAEVRPVVEAGRDDHLRMNVDVVRGQPTQLLHDVGRGGIAQARSANAQIGGVHRDIERREELIADALPIVFREIGERDEVSVQKRVTVIIVFDVQRPPHAVGHLQHKAERAQVIAAADVDVKCGMLEFEAERLIVVAPANASEDHPAAPDLHLDPFVGGVELHIDHIFDRMPVHFDDLIADLQAGLSRETLRLDGGDDAAHL